MITLTILLLFFGSFALYNTSKKAVLSQNLSIEKWLQNNTQQSKIIGLALLVIGLLTAILKFGKTSGILFWLIASMTVLCMLILLYPLKKINYKYVSILFVVFLTIELINTL